ncbi:hypothetical protein ANN_22396 [Periplaneta americana]|uniref:HAT C-terminal dimerisation domain-containing protein n=1 Tax=Periplaneta americana TaxID=6978 RepID=A0ABQ8S8H1_PERAM|nr:hypothetical protein ANN_22396 [Periplaneta americana]
MGEGKTPKNPHPSNSSRPGIEPGPTGSELDPLTPQPQRNVSAERKFTVQQHVGREKHIRAVQLASKEKSTQLLLQQSVSMKENKSSDFYRAFCEAFDISCIEEDLTGSDLAHFNYAPVVTADVERSFSQYKNMLSDNRRSLTFENLRMLVVTYCNILNKGWLKSEVYKRKVETREELLAHILHDCAEVKECSNQLRSATQQLSTEL